MTTHLVDSDWLVDYLKGKAEALALLSPLIEQGSLATTIINYAEISEGLLEAETPSLGSWRVSPSSDWTWRPRRRLQVSGLTCVDRAG